MKKDVAIRVVSVLGEVFKTFKSEWNSLKPDAMDSYINMITQVK